MNQLDHLLNQQPTTTTTTTTTTTIYHNNNSDFHFESNSQSIHQHRPILPDRDD